jgi:ABC-type transport system involved in multi-copper enzyme maturation permease subunit
VLVGLAAIVAVAVLFIASEYERGTIRTTFAASPRRARVLAAKAVVIGGAGLAAGLLAAFGAFLLAGPVLGARGLPAPSLLDGASLRAVVGTAVMLGLVAVLSLAVAAITRRTAAAISVVLLALLVPQLVATGLPVSVAVWVERLTPSAGFAIQQTVDRYDTAIAPLAGLAVLCGYTLVALAGATWLLGRRDA